MYRILYPEDTKENRCEFLSKWLSEYCLKQESVNYDISASCLSKNFTRCYFPISEESLISSFLKYGFISERNKEDTFFNFSSDSPAMKEFRQGWN